MNTRISVRKILSTLLSVTLLCGCATSGVVAVSPDLDTTTYSSASTTRFTDVPSDFWAYEAIDILAEGGLINGYGGDAFGPNDTMSIAQMATVICNAKGVNTGSQNGYWAYIAVEYCISIGCLPDFGEITADVYGAACTREVAVYMMVKGLGSAGVTATNNNLTWADIPDYTEISADYRTTILSAYKLGLINGVDENRTFNPSAELTRAGLCTVLYRAGFTTAAEKPDDVAATGMSGAEIYEVVESWDWQFYTSGTYKQLTATDPLLGGIYVGLNSYGVLSIGMKEVNYAAMVVNGVSVDKHGTPTDTLTISYGCNEDGVYVMSSGWSYEARQQVKELLKMAYPTGYEEAYEALMDVMQQEYLYEVPTSAYPSALRWIDGRTFKVTLDQNSNTAWVRIGPMDDTDYYEESSAGADSGARLHYSPANGSYPQIPTMYEFYKG